MENQAKILSQLTDLFTKINFFYRPQMEALFPELSLSEIECIEIIGKIDQPNVTKLADALYITRGAVSKITKKLIQKQLIAPYQEKENKKEIYFVLTKKGTEINQAHEDMHLKFLAHDRPIFSELTPEDEDRIIHFLERYNTHLDQAIRNNQK